MDNQNAQAEQDKRRKMTDIQRQIIMAEADLKKINNEKMTTEAEASRIKREIDHLKLSIQTGEQKMRGVEQNAMMKQAEVSRLKKQLNLVQ